jgi:hypothetical protein
MKLWASLYLMIWLVFLEIWLALTPLAPPVPLYLHIGLGVLIVLLAGYNLRSLRASTTLGRVKRTARATFALALLMAVLGALVYVNVGSSWTVADGITVLGGLRFLHFVNAMAIFSQVSATAVLYDAWEERDLERSTPPGEIPPAPQPVRTAR